LQKEKSKGRWCCGRVRHGLYYLFIREPVQGCWTDDTPDKTIQGFVWAAAAVSSGDETKEEQEHQMTPKSNGQG